MLVDMYLPAVNWNGLPMANEVGDAKHLRADGTLKRLAKSSNPSLSNVGTMLASSWFDVQELQRNKLPKYGVVENIHFFLVLLILDGVVHQRTTLV